MIPQASHEVVIEFAAILLGVVLCDSLLFDEHVHAVLKTCSQITYLTKLLHDQGLPSTELHCIFHALIVRKIRYAMPAWSGLIPLCPPFRTD